MLIVDAYNVLMADGAGGLDLPDLQRLAARSRYATRPVLLVCDGTGGYPGRPPAAGLADAAGRLGGGVRTLYAGAGQDADGVIESILEADSAPPRLTVVSDDRRLRRAARRRGARWLASPAFLRRLRDDEARARPTPLPPFATDLPLDPQSVGYWLDRFGVEPSARAEQVAGFDEDRTPRHADKGHSAPTPDRAAGRPGRPPRRPPPGEGPSAHTRRQPPNPPRHGPDPARPPELPRGADIDPVLLDALEEWALNPEDLDMRRWLDRNEP